MNQKYVQLCVRNVSPIGAIGYVTNDNSKCGKGECHKNTDYITGFLRRKRLHFTGRKRYILMEKLANYLNLK